MKGRYDLIVFDWDGTLIDSIGWIVTCLRHAADQCGLPYPGDEPARSVIGLGLGEAMQTLFPGVSPTVRDALVDAYRDLYLSKEVSREDLFEGVDAMLAALRGEGYRLAVATGKARAGLARALDATGMAAVFDATRCSDETASKPHPRMLLEIMAETGAQPERTLMVGDSVHDLKMAGNAGVASVGVACGANSRDQLLAHDPLFCLSATAHLLELLA